jgi:hypothetical protein
MDCTTLAAAPVLPKGYVFNASRIADRRMILAGYRLAGLTRLWSVRFKKRLDGFFQTYLHGRFLELS